MHISQTIELSRQRWSVRDTTWINESRKLEIENRYHSKDEVKNDSIVS